MYVVIFMICIIVLKTLKLCSVVISSLHHRSYTKLSHTKFYNTVGCKKNEFREMFMNIHEYFANVHVHITSQAYGHEQFTKYHELLAKVCELGGIFLQLTH